MFYCEGGNCSKKDTCLYHCGVPYGKEVQYRDVSNEGWGHSTSECCETGFYCGDNGDYQHYRSMNIYKDMWEKLKQEIEKMRKFHEDGYMQSMHEAVEGAAKCAELLKLMTQIESENL